MSAVLQSLQSPAVSPDRVLAKATHRAAQRLGLSGAALGRILGVSPASISRLAREEKGLPPDSKEGQLASLVVRVFRSLDALVGNDSHQCIAWMNSHNAALGGVPRELCETPQGLVMTVMYLDAMRATL